MLEIIIVTIYKVRKVYDEGVILFASDIYWKMKFLFWNYYFVYNCIAFSVILYMSCF